MIRFRHHAALMVTALLAVIASTPFLYEGLMAFPGVKSLLILVTLVPLAIAIWAWRAGTDANEYGIRVKALFGRRIVPWTEVDALVPAGRGAKAVLHSGAAVPLTAVKPGDLQRLAQARKAPSPQTKPQTELRAQTEPQTQTELQAKSQTEPETPQPETAAS